MNRRSRQLAIILITGSITVNSARMFDASPQRGVTGRASIPKAAPLTLKQIDQLISIHTPDNVIVEEIRTRGVADPITKQIVGGMRSRGVSAAIVNELTQKIPHSTIIVVTNPAASVTLDGGSAGSAGPDGRLTIGGLDPGTHTVEIHQPEFRAWSSTLQLSANVATTVEAPLQWAVGFLTVSTNLSNAQIQVGSRPVQPNFKRLSLPPGETKITATAPLHKMLTQSASIEPGKETTITLSIDWDATAIDQLASDIHRAFETHRYQAVLDDSAQYLQTPGRNKEVFADIAMSNFALAKLPEFRSAARKALDAGATLHFALQHYHSGLSDAVHPVQLSLTGTTFSFEPQGKCTVKPFEVDVRQIRFGNRTSVTVSRPFSFPATAPKQFTAINLVIPNPVNPKKTENVNLIAPDNMISPQLDAIREFLQDLGR